jgi:galactokinase
MSAISKLQAKFLESFGPPAVLYRAPGRVNLIGEHTDYNDGFVLPAAIGFSCWAAASPRDDDKLVVYSQTYNEQAEASLEGNQLRRAGKWSDYPFGIARILQTSGFPLGGANLAVAGDIPLGAGLSSSAAFEIAIACCLLDLSGHKIDRTKLAQLAQRAENEFVGARCGIMDQFICCHGRAGHALLLDCRTLDHRQVPFPEEMRLVVCNTMVTHEHGTGEYNVRRRECEEGVRRLAAVLPGIRALRDVSLHDLEKHASLLPDVIYNRCRHVITENERVEGAAAALDRGDSDLLRKLMAESHRSLRHDYEVSCRELDLMVELAERRDGVCGSRMTGGGFGGCTVNVVRRANAEAFARGIAEDYQAATGRRPEIYICDTAQGVERVRLDGSESAKGSRESIFQ